MCGTVAEDENDVSSYWSKRLAMMLSMADTLFHLLEDLVARRCYPSF